MIKKYISGVLIAATVILLSGCNVIFDDIEECESTHNIRFVYDMNMSGGDGFGSQVKSVSLWVFEHSSGKFIKRFDDAGEALSKPGYLLSLPGLDPGTYDLIAWGGLGESSSFSVPSAISEINDLNCTLHTVDIKGVTSSNTLLSPLFYGSLHSLTISDDGKDHTYTIYLMKDTNNINISLQHSSDEILNAGDFTIFMDDANGFLSSENRLLPSGDIQYLPWSVKSGTIDMAGENLNFIQSEISTSRLMADRNPVIKIIDKAAGTIVYSIPIVEWAKKLRSLQNLSIGDQEYLDREHEYTIMLYLVSEPEGWKAASIVINGYELE